MRVAVAGEAPRLLEGFAGGAGQLADADDDHSAQHQRRQAGPSVGARPPLLVTTVIHVGTGHQGSLRDSGAGRRCGGRLGNRAKGSSGGLLPAGLRTPPRIAGRRLLDVEPLAKTWRT